MITPEPDLREIVLNNILHPKKDYHSFNRKIDRQKAEEYAEEQHRAFLHHENTEHRRKDDK